MHYLKKTKLILCLLVIFIGQQYSYANVVGSDIQNFNPTTNGLDFVTVESSETLEPGILNLGLFLNYAINSLPNYEDQVTQTRTKFEDTLLSADLNFGYGLGKNWDFGMSFPQVLARSSKDRSNILHGNIDQTGISEIRANTKYRFFGDSSNGLAGIFSINVNLIQNNPFAGDGAGPTYNAQVAYDNRFNEVNWGVNLGYRLRQPGDQIEASITPFRNQYLLSVAASYLLTDWDSKVIGEIYSSFPAEKVDNSTDRDQSSMELLAGIKTDLNTELALHYGAATELYHGSASPDWRVYAGMNWAMGPLFQNKEKHSFQRISPPQEASVTPFSENPEGNEKFVSREVLFDFNSSSLRPNFKKMLGRLAAYLNKKPGYRRLFIEGHTDSVGSKLYNKNLSQARSKSVRRVLIKDFGLRKNKVVAVGYGEIHPIADNGNYQGRAKNRRVEFRIVR